MNFALKNKHSFLLRNKILVFIIVLAAFLRFYKLDQFPVHLGHDEVSQLYDAISIAQTGRDIYGNSYPFIFQSVNDYKPPFYTYATVFAYYIFGWQEVTIRIVGAFFDTLTVIGVYFFANQFLKSKQLALFAAFLTAISPFEIFYARKSFENQTGVFMMLVGFALLVFYLKKKNIKFFFLASLILGLASYVYFAQAILIPLLLFSFVIIFWQQFRPIKILPILIFILIIAPLYYMVFVSPDTRDRSARVFITQDPGLGKELGLQNNALTKGLTFVGFSGKRYLSQFDPKYLFLDGLDMTNGKRDVGPLFVVGLPFVVVGIYLLSKQKTQVREKIFILVWILVGMVPSGLTF